MFEIVTAVGDLSIILFDLLIYMKLTSLKKDNLLSRMIMGVGCTVILTAYFLAAYVFELPASVSSFLCMSLPSLLLFWSLSKYKDTRFFVTFCFVDTVTLVIAFILRMAGVLGGTIGASIGCVSVILLFVFIYIKGLPYFSRYRKLLESVRDGWAAIMVATLIAYFVMIFIAAFPKPLIERLEYAYVYAAVATLVISAYVVFISSLFQKKKLFDLNNQLLAEKQWHNIAYVDGLTKMSNRMAYIERINEIPRTVSDEASIFAVMMDIDGFKKVNDTFGHHVGDTMLVKAAEIIVRTFEGDGYETYRIGGDEFAVICMGVTQEDLEERLLALNEDRGEFVCEFSYGFTKVNIVENNAMENAFIRADTEMYRRKNAKKGEGNKSASGEIA